MKTRQASSSLFEWVRRALFLLEPECAHTLTLETLHLFVHGPIRQYLLSRFPKAPVEVMGLRFPNPIGLAAGMDQHGKYFDALSCLGFGFVEIGGVTPLAQVGNPCPRVFRLTQAQALINRKGFANRGVDYLVSQIKHHATQSILGVNITKGFATPLEQAWQDYVHCFRAVAPYVDYVALNISSPNTPGLRQLQQTALLDQILEPLKQEQAMLSRYVPLVVKISPDLTETQLQEMAACFLTHHIDGVIATNTTISRPDVTNLPHAQESGGLSGLPLRCLSTQVIAKMYEYLQGKIPIIGCGGILSAMDAKEKLAAGASLIQLYTGFVYRGPNLIREIITALENQ